MRGGQLVEEVGLVAQQIGGAGEQRDHVAAGHVVEEREHLVTDAVAAVARSSFVGSSTWTSPSVRHTAGSR
jgi:hypothetical protein